MRFLVDNALSPVVAQRLCDAGHDAVHVRATNLQAAEDSLVLDHAAREDRILISADTDFGTLLALRQEAKPSVVLIRRGSQRRPLEQAALLLANLPAIANELGSGCIAVIDNERLRVRSLPLVENLPRQSQD